MAAIRKVCRNLRKPLYIMKICKRVIDINGSHNPLKQQQPTEQSMNPKRCHPYKASIFTRMMLPKKRPLCSEWKVIKIALFEYCLFMQITGKSIFPVGCHQFPKYTLFCTLGMSEIGRPIVLKQSGIIAMAR